MFIPSYGMLKRLKYKSLGIEFKRNKKMSKGGRLWNGQWSTSMSMNSTWLGRNIFSVRCLGGNKGVQFGVNWRNIVNYTVPIISMVVMFYFVGIGVPIFFGSTYYVATTGDDNDPGSLAEPWKTLTYAASAGSPVSAGDTVNVRAGTYNEQLEPKTSGTAGNYITFQNYQDEVVTIRGLVGEMEIILVNNENYIIIDGFHTSHIDPDQGSGSAKAVQVSHADTTYVEIRNMTIVAQGVAETGGGKDTGIVVSKAQYVTVDNNNISGISKHGIYIGGTPPAKYITVTNNTITSTFNSSIHLGEGSYTEQSILIENNILSGSIIEDGVQFDRDTDVPKYTDIDSNQGIVIRGNFIRNSPGENPIDLKGCSHILIEDNFMYGFDGNADGGLDPAKGDTRRAGASAITHGTGAGTIDCIIRNNVIYDNRGGIRVEKGYKIYNNIFIFNNRDYTGSNSSFQLDSRPMFEQIQLRSSWTLEDISIKNNIIGGGNVADIALEDSISGLDIDYNLYMDEGGGAKFVEFVEDDDWTTHNFADWKTYLQGLGNVTGEDANSIEDDPDFVNVPDNITGLHTLYDFRVNVGSPCINAGDFLTLANGAGVATQTLVVDDAKFFCDGYGIVTGDEIKIGANDLVTITEINYDTNTITIDEAKSWDDDDPVSLDYSGAAPNIGVYTGSGVETGSYYVATDGDDNDDGSQGSPWATITKAATTVSAGDRVYIKKGNYGDENITVSSSGTATNPIIFEGYNATPGDFPVSANRPTLDAVDGTGVAFTINTKDYIYIKYFNINNYNKAVSVTDSEEVVLQHLYCEDTGVDEGSWASTIYFDGSNDCVATDCFFNGVEEGVFFTFEDSTDCSVNNCLLKNGGDGSEEGHVHGMLEFSNGSNNNTIINCVFHNAAGALYGFIGTNSTNYMRNCIILTVTSETQNGGGSSGTFTMTYSCFNDGFAMPAGTGNISTAPDFYDTANNNYHLNSECGCFNNSDVLEVSATSSPCLGAGSPGDDFSDQPLPRNNINMGMYGNSTTASRYHAILFIFIMIISYLLIGIPIVIPLVAYTWTDNASGNTNWNDQVNWNGGAAGFPDDNTDTVIFDGTWDNNCTVNVAITVGEINVNLGYNSTITMDANLTVDDAGAESGRFTINDAQAELDTNGNIFSTDGQCFIDNGTVTTSTGDHQFGRLGTADGYGLRVKGGILTGGSGDWSVSSVYLDSGTATFTSGDLTIVGQNADYGIRFGTATFDDNDGRVIFTYAGTHQLAQGANNPQTLYDVVIENGTTLEYANGDGFVLTVANTFVIDAGGRFNSYEEVSGNPHNLNVTGATTMSGTLDLTGATTVFTGTVTFNASTITSGADDTYNGTPPIIANDVTVEISDSTFTAGNCNCVDTGIIASSTHNGVANAFQLVLAADDTVLSNELTTDPGAADDLNIVVEVSTGAATYKLAGNTTWASLTTGPIITVDTDDANDYDLTVTGDVNVCAMDCNDSACSFGSLSVIVCGTVNLSTATTTITSETAGGYAFNNDGTIVNNNGTVTFTYAGTTLIDSSGVSGNLYNVICNHANLVLTLDTAMTIDNNLTITSGELDTSVTDYDLTITNNLSLTGTLTCNSSALIISGNVTINAGGTFTAPDGSGSFIWSGSTWNNSDTFDEQGGKITLNGTTQTINDSNTWYDFEKTVASSDTLTFENGTTQTFQGTVTLQGASGELLSIVSDSAGNAFNFTMDVTATKGTIQYLSVKDCNAITSDVSHKPIDPTSSTDVSGNTSWFYTLLDGTIGAASGLTGSLTVTESEEDTEQTEAIITASDTASIKSYIDNLSDTVTSVQMFVVGDEVHIIVQGS
jgi:hypothetical protein